MHKLNGFHLLAALLAFTGLASADALAPNWKAHSNTRLARSERMLSRPAGENAATARITVAY